MKKSLLLVVVALFAVSAHAQDVNRSVSVYFDAYSGDAANGNFAGGNCFEFGAGYSQNFSSAQWLTLNVGALVSVGQQVMYDADDKWLGNSQGDTEIYASPRAKISLGFGGYGYLQLDTRSLLAVGAGHGHSFGNAGSVYYGADLEMFATGVLDGADDDGNPTFYYIDLVQAYVGYSVPFASSWGFDTKVMFRFGDEDALVDNFAVRWDNTISYSVDGLGFWGRVRYHASNIANDADIVNSVYLQAGVSYAFDFSGN